MSYKKTIFHWKGLDEALKATPDAYNNFYAERMTKLTDMIREGKTDVANPPAEYLTNPENVSEYIVTRNLLNQEAAQEMTDFFVNLAAKYGVESTIISHEIVDYIGEPPRRP